MKNMDRTKERREEQRRLRMRFGGRYMTPTELVAMSARRHRSKNTHRGKR